MKMTIMMLHCVIYAMKIVMIVILWDFAQKRDTMKSILLNKKIATTYDYTPVNEIEQENNDNLN